MDAEAQVTYFTSPPRSTHACAPRATGRRDHGCSGFQCSSSAPTIAESCLKRGSGWLTRRKSEASTFRPEGSHVTLLPPSVSKEGRKEGHCLDDFEQSNNTAMLVPNTNTRARCTGDDECAPKLTYSRSVTQKAVDPLTYSPHSQPRALRHTLLTVGSKIGVLSILRYKIRVLKVILSGMTKAV